MKITSTKSPDKEFIDHFHDRQPDKRIVFFSQNGSRLYGTNHEGSDYDFTGAALEPLSYFFAFKGFEQTEIKLPEYDSEGTIYSLNKFVRLLAHGNPTLLCLIFNKQAIDTLGLTDPGFIDIVISQKAGAAFYGYAYQQLKRIHTNHGLHITRSKLIEQYGYDTKYAMQIFRLIAQGIEFLSTGKITSPLNQHVIEECMFILNGGYKTLENFTEEYKSRLALLSAAEKSSCLPLEPNYELLNDFLVTIYKSQGM